MNADPTALIREIAAEHGVVLDRDDPILVMQTATRRILQDALLQSQQNLAEAMAQHRSELDVAASKWQDKAKQAASQLVKDVQAEITVSVAREVGRASRTAAHQCATMLVPHEKALSRSTLSCALAAAVAALAAAAVVVSRF